MKAEATASVRRGLVAVSFRESRARFMRRVDAGETPVSCGECGTETDVTSPAHAPTCSHAPRPEPTAAREPSEIYRGRNGRRMTTRTREADGSKTLSEINREHEAWDDAQPMVTSCGVTGCDWSIDSSAAEGRELARAHRKSEHGWMDDNRSRVVEKRVEEAQAALSEREQATLDSSAESQLRRAAAAPTRSESAKPKRGGAQPRAGRPRLWTAEKIVAALQAFAREHNRAPFSAELQAPLPSWQIVRRDCGSYEQAIAAAGLELPVRRRSGRKSSGGAVGDQAVTGSASVISATAARRPGEAAADRPLSDVAVLPVPTHPEVREGPPDLTAVRRAAIAAINAVFDLLESVERAVA